MDFFKPLLFWTPNSNFSKSNSHLHPVSSPPLLQNARPYREAARLQDIIKENEVRLQNSYHLLRRLQLLFPGRLLEVGKSTFHHRSSSSRSQTLGADRVTRPRHHDEDGRSE
ncbi:hypothetical protein SRHO_G00338600 [Serrasalmus rhombeus]